MRRLLNSRPSPAMVVACIALIVALGGTSYAALKLPRNSVGNKQLKSNAVTSGKVRNGALTAKDFRRSSLPPGPRGPKGLKGDPAPGSIPRTAFASRDPVSGPGGGAAVEVGGSQVDLIALSGRAGTAGYTASSGTVTANGASRLIANGQAVILNAGQAGANVSCQIVLIGSDARVLGNYVNANIPAAGGYVPVAVSAGTDVEAGTYDVRLQCASTTPGMSFHRGNLTVALAPR